jgi:hypothetical protein
MVMETLKKDLGNVSFYSEKFSGNSLKMKGSLVLHNNSVNSLDVLGHMLKVLMR